MLTIITAVSCILMLALTVMQTIYVFRFQRIMDRGLESARRDLTAEAPDTIFMADRQTAIVLCLRGTDPTLSECLTGIVSQDHENFRLYCVFDDPSDPAVEYVKNFFVGKRLEPTLHFVTDRPETCTLKCSALISVIEELPEEIEFIALIDADTVADENWLNDLLAPFSDTNVGATTGNRWFSPADQSLGSVFRKIWNAAAVPQVVLYNIGWGGTLAFRRTAIEQANLLEGWRHAFCEDTMTSEALQTVGMRLHRVPNLVMENTESTRLSDAVNWIARQTLTVRLHHKTWPLVLGHGIVTGYVCYVVPLLIILALFSGDYTNLSALVRFFLLYQIFNIGLLAIIDRCNRRVLRSRHFRASDQLAENHRKTPLDDGCCGPDEPIPISADRSSCLANENGELARN